MEVGMLPVGDPGKDDIIQIPNDFFQRFGMLWSQIRDLMVDLSVTNSKLLDRAAQKGLIHKNAAARGKRRLGKLVTTKE